MTELFSNFHGRDFPDYSEDSFNSMLVESGRIIQTGYDLQKKSEFSGLPRNDLKGKFLFPAFCDAHTHFLQTGLTELGTDLSSCRSISDMSEMLSEAAKKNSSDWILAWNLDETTFKEKRFPTLTELNKAVSDKHLWISRVDLHSALVNNKALKWAQEKISDLQTDISADTLRIWKQSFLQLSGMLISSLGKDFILHALEKSRKKCIENGVTFVHALEGGAGINFDVVEIVADFLESDRFSGTIYHQSTNPELVLKRHWNKIGGCLMVDGSFGSRSAALNEPYTDDPSNSGEIYLSSEIIENLLEMCSEKNLQLSLHCIGDRAIKHLLSIHSKARNKLASPALPHRIEHFEMPDSQSLDIAAECGLYICVQPAFETLWGGKGKMYEKRLGPERTRLTNPFKSMLKAGLKIAAGSDSPVTTFNPFQGIYGFLNHPTPTERISLNDALTAYILHPHHFYGNKTDRGMLKAGYKADFNLFQEDIFLISTNELMTTKPYQTFISGKYATIGDML
ncbi:MAG: amidohydrolase [Candidatus Riflebacteria bacterium]|nr:amidohydrolase [Candidatus Riflebacteria bacterium]